MACPMYYVENPMCFVEFSKYDVDFSVINIGFRKYVAAVRPKFLRKSACRSECPVRDADVPELYGNAAKLLDG